MPNPRVYIETTVVSAYHDARTPERLAMTVDFWKTCVETHGREVNLLNALRGFGPVEIIAPPEL